MTDLLTDAEMIVWVVVLVIVLVWVVTDPATV